MNDQTAIGLLRESLLQKDIAADNEAITTLVHQLRCLSLALVQAASFMTWAKKDHLWELSIHTLSSCL